MEFHLFTHKDIVCPRFKIHTHISYRHAMVDGVDKIVEIYCPIAGGEHPLHQCDGLEHGSHKDPCYIFLDLDCQK